MRDIMKKHPRPESVGIFQYRSLLKAIAKDIQELPLPMILRAYPDIDREIILDLYKKALDG